MNKGGHVFVSFLWNWVWNERGTSTILLLLSFNNLSFLWIFLGDLVRNRKKKKTKWSSSILLLSLIFEFHCSRETTTHWRQINYCNQNKENKTRERFMEWESWTTRWQTNYFNQERTKQNKTRKLKKTKQESFVDESWLYLRPKHGCLGIGKGKAVSGTNNYGWDPLWRQGNRHSLLYMFLWILFLDFFSDKILTDPWSLI